jgi:DNA helicase HerA-like ATPase
MSDTTFGTVISTEDSPNTGEFHFVVQSDNVHKGQFVRVQTKIGPVLGTVGEISRANRYFERPESVSEYSKLGVLTTQFPTDEWEYMVAQVKVHGVLGDLGLQRSSLPVKCGASVEPATNEQLKKFLKVDANGLEIGNLAFHELDIKVNLSKLFQKHLAILAMSGSGKSYLAGVLMEELLDREAEKGRLAIVAVDNHGEYVGFKDSIYRDKVKVLEGDKVRIGLRHLSSSQFQAWTGISGVAARYLDEHLKQLKLDIKDKGELLGLDDLIGRITADPNMDKKENVRGPLLASLHDIKRLRLISKADSLKAKEHIKPGTLTVLDLSSVDDLRKKQMIVAYYGHKLFRFRKDKKIPPYVFLVEEAHNFCREKIDRNLALSKGIIETIAREGRKFGASLCLISQRPVQLSTTALSQCNSNIILRITNPFDLKHIGESCEGIDSPMLSSITTLRVGEAMIVGEALGAPVFVKVRKRKTNIKESNESLEDLAKRFEDLKKVKEEEVEAFL